jgi:ribokinase
MSRQPTITVVGSIMTDMVSYVARVPGPGETLIGGRFETGFGGKGANQAVMARRLGASVRMIACVGADAFGDQAIENLVHQGIDAQFVYRSQAATGVAPIWVEADGTNRIIVIPGANDDMDPEQVAKSVLAQRSQVVIGQLEVPQPVTLAGFGAARSGGAITILNPAPAAEIAPELLALTDWLIPNETEFASLLWSRTSTDAGSVTDDHVLALASRVSSRLLVTLGEAGALMVSDGKVMRLPAPISQAVDTTGAGDAFVGAFGYGLASGLAPAGAMALALRCASFSVSRPGTQSSFPTPEESEQLLKG